MLLLKKSKVTLLLSTLVALLIPLTIYALNQRWELRREAAPASTTLTYPTDKWQRIWYEYQPEGEYVQGQKPDAYIELPMGSAGEIQFDEHDNLIAQDHTWPRAWIINLNQDPSWLKPASTTADPTQLWFYNQTPNVLKIFGQKDYKEASLDTIVGNKVSHAAGIVVDQSTTPNKIYVADSGNSRILGFDSMGYCTNNSGLKCTNDLDCRPNWGSCFIDGRKSADLVFGQPNASTGACNGDNNLGIYKNPTEENLCLLDYPVRTNIQEYALRVSFDVDKQGNLYVPDVYNNRVLKYNQPFSSDKSGGKGDTLPDFVWGQDNFNSREINRGQGLNTLDRTSLSLSSHGSRATRGGISVDPEGNLWVADTYNNRVLRFPPGSKQADLVIGQSNFTTNERTGCGGSSPDYSSNRLCQPALARVHPETGKLYVMDMPEYDLPENEYPGPQWDSGRILIFNPPFYNGMSASRVVTPNVPTKLKNTDWKYYFTPTGFAFNNFKEGEYANGTLWVAEMGNTRRVLLIDDWGNPIKAIGVPSFDFRGCDGNYLWNQCRIDIEKTFNICEPWGSVAFDNSNNIYVVDKVMQRIARFKLPYELGVNGCIPQPNGGLFEGTKSNAVSGYNFETSFGTFTFQNQLVVKDWYRFMVWNNYLEKTSGAKADFVVGQSSDDARERNSLGTMAFHTIDDKNRLWTTGNQKITVYQLPLNPNSTPLILEAKLYWADNGAGLTDNIDTRPGYGYEGYSIAFDKFNKKIWLVDRRNNRILRISNYNELQDKLYVDMVIGQPNKDSVCCNQIKKPDGTCENDWKKNLYPKANTLCYLTHLNLDNYGNLYVVENDYECHGNDRIVMFTADDLKNATGMFPNISAKKVFVANNFTEPGHCNEINGPESPVSIAFNSRNQMVVGNDGYYDGAQNERHLKQLWFYDDPLKKDTKYLGDGPDEINLEFDNNWGWGNLAYGRSDGVRFESSRTIHFDEGGRYRFTVGSDDGIRLWIDNVLQIDKWIDRGYATDSVETDLTAGDHTFRIDYYENGGAARVSFSYGRVGPLEFSCNSSNHTDDFSSFSLSSNWTWHHPGGNPSYSLADHPGCFMLSVSSDQSYDHWVSVDKAPQLQRTDMGGGDWTIETHLYLDNYTDQTNFHTGLMVYFDTYDLLYWGPYRSTDLKLERSGHGNILSATYNQREAYLRIRKEGTAYYFDYSSDGNNWTTAGSYALEGKTPQKVGLVTKTWANVSLTTAFDYFDLETPEGPPPALNISPTTLTFTPITQGTSSTESKSTFVYNSGGGTLNWSASEGSSWFWISPPSGSSTGSFDGDTIWVTLENTNGLAAGNHTQTISVSGQAGTQNSPQTVTVNLTVTPATQCSPPNFPSDKWQRVWSDYPNGNCLGDGPDETSLFFDTNWGSGKEIAYGRDNYIQLKSSRTIHIDTAGTYRFHIGSDDGVRFYLDDIAVPRLEKWAVRHYPVDSLDILDIYLSAGDHQLQLDYFENTGAARFSFSYEPIVVNPSALNVSPTIVNLSATQGTGTVTCTSCPIVSNTGGGTLSWSASDDAPGDWLWWTPTTDGNGPTTLWVSATVNGLSAGTYSGTTIVTGAAGTQNSPQTVTVNLTVNPPACTNTAPSMPTLSSPSNGATGQSTSPTVSWNAVSSWGTNCAGNTNTYEVFLDTNSNPTTSRGTVTEGTTSQTISGLANNTTYYWKVRASNGALSSDSSVWSFTTSPSAQCSALNFPSDKWQRVWSDYPNGSCLGDGPGELSEGIGYFDDRWGSGNAIAYGRDNYLQLKSSRTIHIDTAGTYRFHIGSDDGVRFYLDDVLKLEQWLVRHYTVDTLDIPLTSGDHRLQLDYYENTGAARFSFSYEPLACANTAPSVPTLSSPASGSTGQSTSPTVSWNTVSSWGVNCADNTNTYEVFLDTNSNPTTTRGTVPEGTTSQSISGLSNNTLYYWKVRASNGALSSDSSIWSFTTTPPSGQVTWVSPTGYNDPKNAYSYEDKAYDDNIQSRAMTNGQMSDWCPFLELTHNPIPVSKVRLHQRYGPQHDKLDLDVYYNNSWQDVYEGPFQAGSDWQEKTLPQGTQTTGKARIRFHNAAGAQCDLYEFDFGQVSGGGGGLPSQLPGDLDGDCDVDVVDIMKVAAIWNTRTGDERFKPEYDFDSDGRISIVDVMRVAAVWNTRCAD